MNPEQLAKLRTELEHKAQYGDAFATAALLLLEEIGKFRQMLEEQIALRE